MADSLKGDAVGPTWKWLVGILLSIVGIALGAWMNAVWGEMTDLTATVTAMRATLVEISTKLSMDHDQNGQNAAQIQRLWEKYGQDHDTLSRQQAEVDSDHELLHNWVHPDHAVH